MALSGIWFRGGIGWVGSVLAVLFFPTSPMAEASLWYVIDSQFLIACGLSCLSAWQLARGGGKVLSRLLYPPFLRNPRVRLHLLLLVITIIGGTAFLSFQLPVPGAVAVLFFTGREARAWWKKRKALESIRYS
ncbi:MAG: hypothetical protein M0Z65_07940 [Firmicutes bacterium]|uniref:Uncharacterized protein n=1 Tax=Melghirimyces thermohalophilus TaxID=1236220 RepID=A0A1G6LR22_9BACL|nr:hypothetical protein [Melghirimyces thermohalophilus]MDA8353103.1 hypothetical protein [Bacillota bacterium]SDC45146.1 hypothetical protein SAMN04488112_10866 [Melghirimyces thermohalophilus]